MISPSNPKQSRAVATRERILTTAAQLFAERGVAATSTNHIAEHAHISIGSLYRYFPDKHAIADVLRQRVAAELEAQFTNAVVDGISRPADDGVAASLRGIVEALSQRQSLIQALGADSNIDVTLLAEVEKRLVILTRAYLLHQIGPQSEADLDARATAMVTVGLGTSLRLGLMTPVGSERDRVLDEVARMLTTWIAATTPET